MKTYFVKIKPGVYYIDRGKNVITGADAYDLTYDFDKATIYPENEYNKAVKHSLIVYGEVCEVEKYNEIEKLKKENEELRFKLENIRGYIDDYLDYLGGK